MTITKEITPSIDQQAFIQSASVWMNSNSDQIFYLLSGQAGVGKTTCIRWFLESLPPLRVAIVAPTNKAVHVISTALKGMRGVNVTYATIYSLLGLKLEASGAVKELADSGKRDVGQYDLVVCDEGSMLNEIVMAHLERKIKFTGTKVLLAGDKEQLPPVGEDESCIWKRFKPSFTLDKVERHDSDILAFVQSIRANPNPVFKSVGSDVTVYDESTEDAFLGEIERLAKEGVFHAGDAKAIAWRNVTVDTLNFIIRDAYAGKDINDRWVVGDRVIMAAPINSADGKDTLATTDEEGVIRNIGFDRHPKYPQFRVYKLDVDMDYGDSLVLNVIHEDSEDDLKDYLDSLAAKKQWKMFWDCKDAFHQIKLAFALTSHRSQGSTFLHVFIDSNDIMLNRKVDERSKCLYVAASRASKKLHILT